LPTNLNQRIQELVTHAYAHAPAVRQIMDGAGVTPADIQSPSDLARLPVTSKDRLVEIHQANPPFGGFLTIPPEDLPRIYMSPGPIYDPQPTPDNPEALIAPFKYVGFGRGDRVLNTFMYHLTPAGMLVDQALRLCGATVLPTGPGNTELQLMMMSALGATGFVGQPSYLMTLLDKAPQLGISKEGVTIKKALFSAEPYTPSQRARFEGEYGMKTTSAYGTADLGILGYTIDGMMGFCMLDHIYVEICDPQTGELLEDGSAGEIVITTFNKSYPLIRFGTGDLGALAPTADPLCGDAQQLLGLFGRSGDAIKVRGMFLHPNQLMAAMARVPAVKHAQAIISRDGNHDVMTVRVELHPDADTTQLEAAVMAHVNAMARLRVDAVQIVESGVIDPSQRLIRDERKWD
jgi:phenylacetate-CoA ligase